MLTTINALFDGAPQHTKCIDCASPVPAKIGNGRLYTSKRCTDCTKAHRLKVVGASVARQRRKRGIPEVKGTVFQCAACGCDVARNRSLRAKFCDPCRVEAARDRARERVNRLSRDRGAPQIGERIACKHCRMEFPRASPRECYCGECKAKQRRGDLPHLKAASRRYKVEVWSKRLETDFDLRAKQRRHLKLSRVRRKAAPSFTINERMSAGIRYSLGRAKAGSRWELLVGYSLADLMRHLERQFLPGMTWVNRGEWHIDHIVPLSSFKFSSPDDAEFRAAWALTNLRPLWWADNLGKSDKRTFLI